MGSSHKTISRVDGERYPENGQTGSNDRRRTGSQVTTGYNQGMQSSICESSPTLTKTGYTSIKLSAM